MLNIVNKLVVVLALYSWAAVGALLILEWVKETYSALAKKRKQNAESAKPTQGETMTAWIARDKDGTLFIYPSKPYKPMELDHWLPAKKNPRGFSLDSGRFPGVTFENSPKEITVTISETPNY